MSAQSFELDHAQLPGRILDARHAILDGQKKS